jgi:hypothetical protein
MKKINLIEKVFLISWPYAFLFSLIVYLITKNFDFVLSFILGVASSLLMNSLNYRIMKNLYANNPNLIKSRQIYIYLVKFIFFGLILYITYNSEAWNVYYTFVGLLTYRIVSIPVILFSSDKGVDDSD